MLVCRVFQNIWTRIKHSFGTAFRLFWLFGRGRGCAELVWGKKITLFKIIILAYWTQKILENTHYIYIYIYKGLLYLHAFVKIGWRTLIIGLELSCLFYCMFSLIFLFLKFLPVFIDKQWKVTGNYRLTDMELIWDTRLNDSEAHALTTLTASYFCTDFFNAAPFLLIILII